MKWNDKQLLDLFAGASRPPALESECPSAGLEARIMADWRSRNEGEAEFLRPFRMMLISSCCLMLLSIAFGYYLSVTESAPIGLELANSAIERTIGQ